MVQYPTLHYSTLTPSFLCGLWGDGYTYAFSNMLSGLFLVSLKALNTESWCRRVNFMNSPQSAIMCSQKSRWMNGTERNNGNMSHSFYFWQHWVTVLGQIPYYKKHIISAGRKMSSAMSNCTGHRHFSSGCFYKVQGWHEAALLADTPHVGMLGIIRGSMLLWGMTPLMWRMLAWWGQQRDERKGKAPNRSPPNPPPRTEHNPGFTSLNPPAAAESERTSRGAVCDFLSVCVCVLCM